MTLPRWKRRHMHALYGLLRSADEIVDVLDPVVTVADRARLLGDLRDELFAGLAAGPATIACHPILPAIVHTVRGFGIRQADIEKFITSMQADLSRTTYETFDDLLGYMEGSAAAVGAMTLPILEPLDEAGAMEPARHLGLAFQLVNFVRDIGEDLAVGRVYLPLEDLERFGVTLADLFRHPPTAATKDLLSFELERARKYFRSALPVIDLVVPSSRPFLRTAIASYRGIASEAERRNYHVLPAKVALRFPQRVRVFAPNAITAAITAHRDHRVNMWPFSSHDFAPSARKSRSKR